MFEQNRDPNYFNEFQMSTNCGSFAFNICEWYCPDENFDEDDYELAYRLVDMECMDEYEAMCLEAAQALTALGASMTDALKAVRSVPVTEDMTSDYLIREALKNI